MADLCEMCEHGEQCIHCIGAERDRYRLALRRILESEGMHPVQMRGIAREALDG